MSNMKGIFRIVTVAIFGFTALGIGALVLFPVPRTAPQDRAVPQNRVVIPRTLDAWAYDEPGLLELAIREPVSAMIPLGEGNVVVSVLEGNFYRNPVQEQVVAYRNLLAPGSPINLTFIGYDAASRTYRRLWSAPTAATRPETVTLDTQDLIGDRSVCVLLSGMNNAGEHTLTVFRMNPAGEQEPFTKIADIRVDGSITVREVARSQAYQMGLAVGQSFTIAAQGRDFDSNNIMDQVEIIYAYNPVTGFFEQRSRTRIAGAQIEQRRVREILGSVQSFESFIAGLWFYVTPQGTIDRNQYIYFDPSNRQIIFFGDGTMQIFSWRNSIAARGGLYITSQNISIATIRRSIVVQLESLEGIRIRTTENLRPQFRVMAAPWDGSYRAAGRPETLTPVPAAAVSARIDARYDSPIGRFHFFPCGSYEIHSGGTSRRGTYSFFSVNGANLLELRSSDPSGPARETFLVEGAHDARHLSLHRVRLGARGVERLNEGAVSLTFVEGSL
ncbi:MAG: pallilysin-related adhesin [Treponema sp.]|nr:pallilysin-related adhesin [Treponema sp.]